MLEEKIVKIFMYQWKRMERVPRSTPLSTTITDDENGLKIETIALDSVDLDNSHHRVPYRYTLELPAAQWNALKSYTYCEMNISETSASSYLISCAKTAFSRIRTSESKHGLILAGVGLGTLLADICLNKAISWIIFDRFEVFKVSCVGELIKVDYLYILIFSKHIKYKV